MAPDRLIQGTGCRIAELIRLRVGAPQMSEPRASGIKSSGFVIRRAHEAAALGLTNEEYTLEILKRGRYLQASEEKRIAEIKSGWVHDLVE
jgi:hypothetical protein